MNNIISYVNEYGRYSFYEKPFNEVDNVVFVRCFTQTILMTILNLEKHTH